MTVVTKTAEIVPIGIEPWKESKVQKQKGNEFIPLFPHSSLPVILPSFHPPFKSFKSIHPSIHPSIHQSIHLSIHPHFL